MAKCGWDSSSTYAEHCESLARARESVREQHDGIAREQVGFDLEPDTVVCGLLVNQRHLLDFGGIAQHMALVPVRAPPGVAEPKARRGVRRVDQLHLPFFLAALREHDAEFVIASERTTPNGDFDTHAHGMTASTRMHTQRVEFKSNNQRGLDCFPVLMLHLVLKCPLVSKL